jgi:hypothetical protein
MSNERKKLEDGHMPSGKANEKKLMVLAIGLEDDEVVITPLDVEHDDDDQSPLSPAEAKERTQMKVEFAAYRPDMQRGLCALHKMFSGRLYRGSFRTFENFCFALHGMKRLNDTALSMARMKTAQRFEAANQEVGI